MGTFVDGVYVKGTPTTFNIEANIQPAVEISRVTAGRDLVEKEWLQQGYDVCIFYTKTALIDIRNQNQDPDQMFYAEGLWTVVRCEPWNFRGPGGYTNDKFWKGVITRKMAGASPGGDVPA